MAYTNFNWLHIYQKCKSYIFAEIFMHGEHGGRIAWVREQDNGPFRVLHFCLCFLTNRRFSRTWECLLRTVCVCVRTHCVQLIWKQQQKKWTEEEKNESERECERRTSTFSDLMFNAMQWKLEGSDSNCMVKYTVVWLLHYKIMYDNKSNKNNSSKEFIMAINNEYFQRSHRWFCYEGNEK